MLLLGMAIGVFGTVTVLSAMGQGTPLSKGVMAVTGHHFGAVRKLSEAGRCDPAGVEPHLRRMRALTDDLAVAFLPTGIDDALFERHAAGYRDALDAALVNLPTQCQALGEAIRAVGATCKSCHQDFRG